MRKREDEDYDANWISTSNNLLLDLCDWAEFTKIFWMSDPSALNSHIFVIIKHISDGSFWKPMVSVALLSNWAHIQKAELERDINVSVKNISSHAVDSSSVKTRKRCCTDMFDSDFCNGWLDEHKWERVWIGIASLTYCLQEVIGRGRFGEVSVFLFGCKSLMMLARACYDSKTFLLLKI